MLIQYLMGVLFDVSNTWMIFIAGNCTLCSSSSGFYVSGSSEILVEFSKREYDLNHQLTAWWRNQMETFSSLLAICVGNSPVPGEFPAQRQVTRSFDVFFDLHPNKRLRKQWWGWWFETPSCPLWRHRNGAFSSIFFCCQFRHAAIYCISNVCTFYGTFYMSHG